jgi:hypothetical protein
VPGSSKEWVAPRYRREFAHAGHHRLRLSPARVEEVRCARFILPAAASRQSSRCGSSAMSTRDARTTDLDRAAAFALNLRERVGYAGFLKWLPPGPPAGLSLVVQMTRHFLTVLITDSDGATTHCANQIWHSLSLPSSTPFGIRSWPK